MMYAELNASGFKYNSTFYNAEFEGILSKVIACYYLMLADSVSLTNDENEIRNVLLIKYLRSNTIRKRIGLTNYLFDREVPEDKSIGRTDIKIQTLNTFEDTDAYYILECKRLDAANLTGSTGLNSKYIENGICRFTSKYYTSHYRTSGMIGFVVGTLDISENTKIINHLLKVNFSEANTTQELTFREIATNFSFSYYSVHGDTDDRVALYHLMLDFSKNV